jgi:hypothetical protein
MSELVCPKCRQAVSDAALDAGNCPYCGFDGPMVLAGGGGKWAWLVATAAVVLSGAAVGGYLLIPRNSSPAATPAPEVAAVTPAPPPPVDPPLPAPPPTATGQQSSAPQPAPPAVAPAPKPVERASPPKPEPPVAPKPEPIPPPKPVVPPPMPVVAPAPKPERPKPGPVVRIDPKEERERKLDSPNGIAAVPDMTREDRLTLTGRVRILRIGSVGGKATLDASGLEAEEIIITGDVSNTAVVKLNAPNGKVTIGGHVVGSAKLTVNAPGGEVVVAASSGKLDGSSEITVTAKRLEVQGPMAGEAKMVVMLTAGGSAQFGKMEGRATVIYKQ